jgi:hypothetical protein
MSHLDRIKAKERTSAPASESSTASTPSLISDSDAGSTLVDLLTAAALHVDTTFSRELVFGVKFVFTIPDALALAELVPEPLRSRVLQVAAYAKADEDDEMERAIDSYKARGL